MRSPLFSYTSVGAACIAIAAAVAMPQAASAQLLGPTPYLSSADSPFTGGSFTYFHLETFEDGTLNTPGVAASAGAPLGPGGNTDSVDADDGATDGSGTGGNSFFSGGGSTGITFTFNAGTLGALPTHVGIVWTDGSGGITFEAFDAGGISLGTVPGNHADGSFSGTTAEDRFYGVINAGGVSSIRILNASGGIEVDHLQYGLLTSNGVVAPEAGTLLLAAALLPLAGVAIARHRRRGRR